MARNNHAGRRELNHSTGKWRAPPRMKLSKGGVSHETLRNLHDPYFRIDDFQLLRFRQPRLDAGRAGHEHPDRLVP